MISLQILNKIITTADISIVNNNALTEDHFMGYENELSFILNHVNEYGNVPDKATFLSTFPEFEFLEVSETDEYLVDTINEEYLYYKSVAVLQQTATLLNEDSNEAVALLLSKLPELQVVGPTKGIDIIKSAIDRLSVYKTKQDDTEHWYITTGLPELDSMVYGWAKGEELVVFFARTGQGKSWVLMKSATHAWQIGNNVGYISPEMSDIKIGYRFDTLNKNFSNMNLVRGEDEEGYEEYINNLTGGKFVVAIPKDFNRKITVSKLKQFVKAHELNMLCIDGITYMTDERYKRGDNKTTSLTNISEDLMDLSIELKIPVIVAVQSNRQGVVNNNEDESDNTSTPELENIKDSDGIAHNATKVFALRQTGAGLLIANKKHRDGETGGHLTYYWDIDKGEFKYIPSNEDSNRPESRQQQTEQIKQKFKNNTEVF